MGAIQKDELVSELKNLIPHMENVGEGQIGDAIETYRSIYLGSVFALDPCGKYHHALSPNDCQPECEEYWQNLEEAASELGGWIESGEGDPCDQFFCMPALVTDEEPDISF